MCPISTIVPAFNPTFRPITPILRIFDVGKAREFYCDFLGLRVDWEHRFAADLPLYFQVSGFGLVLHLSEHHGDACPGAALRIGVDDLDSWQARLAVTVYRYARPGIVTQPWGRDMSVHDPFGNRLIFTDITEIRRSTSADHSQ